jgi:hypothetical protein
VRIERLMQESRLTRTVELTVGASVANMRGFICRKECIVIRLKAKTSWKSKRRRKNHTFDPAPSQTLDSTVLESNPNASINSLCMFSHRYFKPVLLAPKAPIKISTNTFVPYNTSIGLATEAFGLDCEALQITCWMMFWSRPSAAHFPWLVALTLVHVASSSSSERAEAERV